MASSIDFQKREVPVRTYVLIFLPAVASVFSAEPDRISRDSKVCLGCHEEVTPGIVGDWRRSRHARTSVGEALKKKKTARRVSVPSVPDALGKNVVGCAECHTAEPDAHADTFEHNGFRVHVVVTPKDCARCHPAEVKDYSQNLMAYARRNLRNNPLYHTLVSSVNGPLGFKDGRCTQSSPHEATNAEACDFCHGTRVTVVGTETRETVMDEMEFPVLKGWPNQGCGRENPDGTRGSCTACHPRHGFSIEVARKPSTCSECHKGPDVPAYAVYMVSKHGALYSSLAHEWNFNAVPWTVGRDFTAPTCAACHVSLIANEKGAVLAERTHRMNDRSAWRLFGLIYAHPHPRGEHRRPHGRPLLHRLHAPQRARRPHPPKGRGALRRG